MQNPQTPKNPEGDRVNPIQLVHEHGAPTVRDVDLGVRLGMRKPTNIRTTIEKNRDELERFGSLHAARAVIEAGKGAQREGVEYQLNEEQAVLVCILSRAPRAKECRAEVVSVFTAYRRGQLVPDLDRAAIGGIMKGIVNKALNEALPSMIAELMPQALEYAMARDPRLAAVCGTYVKDVLDKAGVPSKGRRGLQRRLTNALRAYCERNDHAVRRDRRDVLIFDPQAVEAFMRAEGAELIAEHEARRAGQTVLPFRKPQEA